MSTQQETVADRWILKDLNLVPIAESKIQYDDERDGVMLVMGPTGAGKSRFIESLARNDALGISKDQLDSVTQVITTYEFMNIEAWKGPGTSITKYGAEEGRFYILDTPGFSDSQISEFEIIEMVKEWMNAHNCSYIGTILYLWPITDTRLPGSKRRTIEMLKLLAAINTDKPGEIVVITTMWDRLWNERAIAAAEERFVHLQDNAWKDLLEAGGNLKKFTNTHSSALDCLTIRKALYAVSLPQAILTGNFQDVPFSPHLYHDLLDRIQAAQQHKGNIDAELSDPIVCANQELKAYTEEQLHNTERLLTKFEGQLIAFGDPPVGFEDAIPFIQSIIEKPRREVQDQSQDSDRQRGGFRKAKNFVLSKLRDVRHKIRK
ncbi:hypothetical protein BJ165DRAFT_1486900 [Panaeolus papilionaceus]|nr:hypothetical protein BJ165DRAFT_1486900 [Panaeolus papilionaceus]